MSIEMRLDTNIINVFTNDSHWNQNLLLYEQFAPYASKINDHEPLSPYHRD